MASDHPSISVIIPVYNGETFLAECLDSVLQQRLKNIEVIVVNDGSTDASVKIVKSYSDKRIILLNQENQGRMKARVRGLNVARGEYIAFLDCDDYISYTMYYNMYSAAMRKNADIVSCGFVNIDEKGNEIQREIFSNNFDETKTYKILPDSPPSLCNSIFHNFLFQKDIPFTNLSRGEDLAVVPCLFYYAHNTFMLDEASYYYRNTIATPKYISGSMDKYPTNLLKDLESIPDLFEAGRVLADFFLDKNTSATDLIPYTLKFPDFFNRYNYKYVKDYFDTQKIWAWYMTYLIEFIVKYHKYYESMKSTLKFENKVVVQVLEKTLKNKKYSEQENLIDKETMTLINTYEKAEEFCKIFSRNMSRALFWEFMSRIQHKCALKK